jgi:hypothetical protein
MTSSSKNDLCLAWVTSPRVSMHRLRECALSGTKLSDGIVLPDILTRSIVHSLCCFRDCGWKGVQQRFQPLPWQMP